jgi:hypothetical protein
VMIEAAATVRATLPMVLRSLRAIRFPLGTRPAPLFGAHAVIALGTLP